MSHDPEHRLAASWEANASAWIRAVRGGHIPSRTQATDAAIVQAVLDATPARVLDLGCGEGWLSRALAAHDLEVVGIDSSEALIAAAREAGGAEFLICSYADIAKQPTIAGSAFDVIVCNFALLQEQVVPLLGALRRTLLPGGALIIQTVHPWTAAGDRYENGWRQETFEDMSGDFRETMPWYYRTLASWTTLLRNSGFVIRELREPAAYASTSPLSIIMIASAASTESVER